MIRGSVRLPTPLIAAQLAAALVVLERFSHGRRRRPALAAATSGPPAVSISVVIPARDEALRIGSCLTALRDDPDVGEVIVVDDRSADDTAAVAAQLGARVFAGAPLPNGWVGKPWALQQGLQAASGDVVVTLDADTRPRPGLVRELAAVLEAEPDSCLVTGGARFVCESAAERLLHPSMLATLVYRTGALDALDHQPPASRVVANGQCLCVRRDVFSAAGGFGLSSGHMTDDVALARALARRGWRIAFVDAADLLEVRMYESAAETWREWGRSIAMADVTTPAAQAVDLAAVWLCLVAPPLRLLAGRATALDRALLALRALVLMSLARVYTRRGVAFWLSPLLDPLCAARLTYSAIRPRRVWRGRSYA
jgi:dolichol-phosphate mannosyltransferase